MSRLQPYGFEKKMQGELSFKTSGYEACYPGKRVGPTYPDHYIIHFILNGKGRYQYKGQIFHLEKGQGFVMFPHELVYYTPDEQDPWEYYWLGVDGKTVDEFFNSYSKIHEVPLISYEPEIIDHIIKTKHIMKQNYTQEEREFALLRELSSIFFFLSKNKTALNVVGREQKTYLQRAVDYMELFSYRPLQIAEVASALHIDRTYLYHLFKQNYNMSPKEYLIQFRMEKACKLMSTKHKEISLKEISNIVGYRDYGLFSKMFKKYTGYSPKGYVQKEVEE